VQAQYSLYPVEDDNLGNLNDGESSKTIVDYFELFFEGDNHSSERPLNPQTCRDKFPRPQRPFQNMSGQEVQNVVDTDKLEAVKDKIFLIPGSAMVRNFSDDTSMIG
jgi:hypothetical protein